MTLVRLPGLTDIHVHLRDPGESYKEDFYTGTMSALAGGATTIFDMPNNLTPVFSEQVLHNKINIAKRKAVCDWALYFGSTGDNLSEFEKVINKVIGLKVYLSLTTGRYVVSDADKIKAIFVSWPKNKIIVFHAEGNRVDLVIKFTEQFGNKVHLTHVSTRDSLEKIIIAKKDKLPITCDAAPHHLFLTKNTSEVTGWSGSGSHGSSDGVETGIYSVKPPLATQQDQDFLWQNLQWIDCLASDHAPHTLEEKKSENPPPGLPGLETILPLLLKSVSDDRLSLNYLRKLISDNPRKIFALPPDNSSFIEVDLKEEYEIDSSNLFTKCRWSPFNGWPVKGRVKRVYLRGQKVFENGQVLVDPGFGKNVI